MKILMPIYMEKDVFLRKTLAMMCEDIESNRLDVQIILIQDGATEKRWLNDFSPHVQYVYHSENVGRGLHRQRCLEHVVNDYFTWLDGDDFVFPSVVSNVRDRMIEASVEVGSLKNYRLRTACCDNGSIVDLLRALNMDCDIKPIPHKQVLHGSVYSPRVDRPCFVDVDRGEDNKWQGEICSKYPKIVVEDGEYFWFKPKNVKKKYLGLRQTWYNGETRIIK